MLSRSKRDGSVTCEAAVRNLDTTLRAEYLDEIINTLVVIAHRDIRDAGLLTMGNLVAVIDDTVYRSLNFRGDSGFKLFAPRIIKRTTQIENTIHFWIMNVAQLTFNIICNWAGCLLLGIRTKNLFECIFKEARYQHTEIPRKVRLKFGVVVEIFYPLKECIEFVALAFQFPHATPAKAAAASLKRSRTFAGSVVPAV